VIGLDTSALIDLFKNNTKLIELLSILNEKSILTRASYLELLFGINPKEQKHLKEEEYFDELFQQFDVLELDKESSKRAADIFWLLSEKGETIDKFDCIIAGIYISNNVKKIITKNIKHFNKIPDLEIISY